MPETERRKAKVTIRNSTVEPSAYSRLVEHLRQLEHLYSQLLETENRKKEAIRHNRMADVQALNDAEEHLLDRFGEENRRRREALEKWQRERGLDADPLMTISGMLEELDAPGEREAIRELGNRLEKAAEQLKAAAEINRELLQVMLDLTLDMTEPGKAPGDDYIYRNPKDEPGTVRRPSGYDVRM